VPDLALLNNMKGHAHWVVPFLAVLELGDPIRRDSAHVLSSGVSLPLDLPVHASRFAGHMNTSGLYLRFADNGDCI